MNSSLSNEQKKQLSYQRQNAVRNAWKIEKSRVSEGFGTRDWTLEQQKEILERGALKGYDGHHMKSVSKYPQYAGNPKNIQFLTEVEHFEGAHRGSFHNLTNGYYDPETQTMSEFEGDELIEIPVNELSEKYIHSEFDEFSVIRNEYMKDFQSSNAIQKEIIDVAKDDYVQIKMLEQNTNVCENVIESNSYSNRIGR